MIARLQICCFGAGWSPGCLWTDVLFPYRIVSLCVCVPVFLFLQSLKLKPTVPCSASSIPGSLGWISQQSAGRAASLLPRLFDLFWASMPGTPCWHLPAVTLVEEPPSSSRVTQRQGWWCFAGSEELSWAVISSLSFPLRVQRGFCSPFCVQLVLLCGV